MSTNQIVISRYSEDLSWTESLPKIDSLIFIYNKGRKINSLLSPEFKVIDLENIGREAHTYLHTI